MKYKIVEDKVYFILFISIEIKCLYFIIVVIYGLYLIDILFSNAANKLNSKINQIELVERIDG